MILRLSIAGLVGIPLSIALIVFLHALGVGAAESGGLSWSLSELGRSWLYQEAWSMRSINFRETASPFWLASPLMQVTFWLVASLSLFLLLSLKAQQPPRRWLGAGLFLLVAWLVLDLHWQWQLAHRLTQTWRDYAELTDAERVRAKEPDASLARIAELVRAQVPDSSSQQPSSRMVLVTADPGGYVPLRARYHLLPLNVHPGMAHLPLADSLRPGDFLLLILPPAGILYEAEQQQLVQGERSIPAERVLTVANVAFLFRVREN